MIEKFVIINIFYAVMIFEYLLALNLTNSMIKLFTFAKFIRLKATYL